MALKRVHLFVFRTGKHAWTLTNDTVQFIYVLELLITRTFGHKERSDYLCISRSPAPQAAVSVRREGPRGHGGPQGLCLRALGCLLLSVQMEAEGPLISDLWGKMHFLPSGMSPKRESSPNRSLVGEVGGLLPTPAWLWPAPGGSRSGPDLTLSRTVGPPMQGWRWEGRASLFPSPGALGGVGVGLVHSALCLCPEGVCSCTA